MGLSPTTRSTLTESKPHECPAGLELGDKGRGGILTTTSYMSIHPIPRIEGEEFKESENN